MDPGTAPGSEADRNTYLEWRRWLQEHIDAYDGGAVYDGVSVQSWSHTLRDTGGYRWVLAGNIAAHQQALAEREQERLRDWEGELEAAISALERVRDAVDDAETVNQLTKSLLKLNEVAEAVREPNLENLVGLLPLPDQEDIIEGGIAMLGRYAVALELARAGYSNPEEIQGRIRSVTAAAFAARAAIESALGRRDEALQLRDVPSME